MVNAQLFKCDKGSPICVNIREGEKEVLESDENGIITLKYKSFTPRFVYDKSHNKLEYELIGDNKLKIAQPYKSVVADYYYEYTNGY